MFHIKNDKRSKNSAKLIIEGLYKCLNVMPFTKITVTDIQKSSFVGRATFYRLFDSLPDVLAYECDCIFKNFLQKKLTRNIEDFISEFFELWMNHTVLLEAIISSNHLELFYQVYRSHVDEVGDLIETDATLSEDEIDYLTATTCAVIIGMLEVWIKHEKKESLETLTLGLKRILNTVCQHINI